MSVERVTITALFYGQRCQNVLHFNNPDGLFTTMNVCEEVRNEWIGTVANKGIHQWTPSNIVWVMVSCQRLGNPPPAPTHLTVNIPGVQGPQSEQIPFACVVLKFQTALAGRRGRGRSYCPGVMQGFLTNGLIDADFNAFAATALTAMNARFKAGGSGPLTLLVGPKNGVVLADFTMVEAITVSNFVGVQRRRNIGFGI